MNPSKSSRPPSVSLICSLIFSAAVSSSTFAEDPAQPLSPRQDYAAERSSPVEYKIDFSVVVTPPYGAKTLRVWLPIPPSDFAQSYARQSLSTFPLTVEPTFTREEVFGNQFAYFEFEKPQGAQLIRHQFTMKTWQLRWNLDPLKVSPPKSWSNEFIPYLRGEGQAVVVDAPLLRALGEAAPKRLGNGLDFASMVEWVERRMLYDHSQASLAASSEHALQHGVGHCSDYHGLCAAMGRGLGYPTRVVYGVNPFPKNSPSHCKLEAFLPPYGWVSFDVSETQKMIRAVSKSTTLSDAEKTALRSSAMNRLHHGFRDNTWFLQTRGTDYALAPPASKSVPVVRTIFAEADGEPLPEPDPGDKRKREFSWMTIHKYEPDREVPYPFTDLTTLPPAP